MITRLVAKVAIDVIARVRLPVYFSVVCEPPRFEHAILRSFLSTKNMPEFHQIHRIHRPLVSLIRQYIPRTYKLESTLVTIRVSRKLKKKMKDSKMNWSQELRKTIEEKLGAKERREAVSELERVLMSVKPGFDTLAAIKESRLRD